MYLHRPSRLGFTLIELLVVITLIILIASVGVLAILSIQDRNVQFAADQIQSWLLIAKQRARRDGLPTGLRINFAPPNNQATTCSFIQQPEDYGPQGTSCSGVGTSAVTFASTGTVAVDLIGANVQPGDYLEVYHGGGVYPIAQVNSSTSLALTTDAYGNTGGPNCITQSGVVNSKAGEYRIRRQPILLAGEDTMTLPSGSVVIDQSHSVNIPIRSVVSSAGTTSYFEILFSPSGNLVGRGSGSDQICILYVYDTSKPNNPKLLVAVQAHTGFIGVQPLSSTSDPYAFCRDGRSSGL